MRNVRHWKQRFDPNAEFVWRKGVVYDNERVVYGQPISPKLKADKARLRRFWDARVIELAEFIEPNVLTGQKSGQKEESKPQKRGRKPNKTRELGPFEI
jgi:hypothetical protein